MEIAIDPGCSIPTRAHPYDAGIDLFSAEDGWILPKSRKIFSTGVHAAIPQGYVGMLTSKSSMMAMGITNRGTIDSGFTGAIKAVLFNHSWKPIKIKKGQKVAQLVIMPIVTPSLYVVDKLKETDRGSGGFGSTGKF